MSWERLRVFVAIAEHGSIAGAANALHITGPAVSQQVRKLERELGCPLLEPDGRRVRLSPAGWVVAARAQDMAAAVDAAERELANLEGQIVGPLALGCVASAIHGFMPTVLRRLTERYPRLRPTLYDGEVVDMIPALQERRLDVVIAESWPYRPPKVPAGIRLTELCTEDVALAVSDAHPFARREVVRLAELADQTWASCPPGTEAHEALLQLLRAHDIDARVRYCVADFSTQLLLVAADLAVALVPRLARNPLPPGVRFIPCDPPVTRSIAVATTNSTDTPALRAFLHELHAVLDA